MVPFLLATHSPKSPVPYASGKRAKPCAEGSRQGAAEAGIAASVAIQEPLESADEAARNWPDCMPGGRTLALCTRT